MRNFSKITLVCFMVVLLTTCERKTYYQGEYIIVNDCDVAIDVYTVGRNAPSIGDSREIHDHIPAKSTMSLRKIKITDEAIVKGIFVYIEIYRNGQKSIKNPMEQYLWIKTLTDNQLTYTLVVDSSFF